MKRIQTQAFETRRHRFGWASLALVLLAGLVLAGTLRWGNAPSAQRRNAQHFSFTGMVKTVDKPNRRATIKHDKVGDFMEPMTMPFVIKDDKALNELRSGDQIKARLVVTDDGAQWLEQVIILPKPQVMVEHSDQQHLLAFAGVVREARVSWKGGAQ
jgi:Cu/Ag efflux protein CusF